MSKCPRPDQQNLSLSRSPISLGTELSKVLNRPFIILGAELLRQTAEVGSSFRDFTKLTLVCRIAHSYRSSPKVIADCRDPRQRNQRCLSPILIHFTVHHRETEEETKQNL